MPSTLLIYENHARESKLAARVVVDDDGKTWFVPGEEDFDQVMDIIGGGAWSPIQRKFFDPSAGEDYLTAVEDMLARSTAWSTKRVQPTNEGGDES